MPLPLDPSKVEEFKKKIGDANRGHLTSAETREKLSKSVKERWANPEYRKRLSESHKNSIPAQENIKKIISANIGRKCTPESIQKMRDAQKNRAPMSEERKKKISAFRKTLTGDKNPNFGKKYSKEVREKMGNGRRGKPHSAESRAKISKGHMGKKKSLETCKKMSEVNNMRYASSWWYGSVTYYTNNNNVYCEKWKDVNPRVKAFFNHTCILCGEHIPKGTGTIDHKLIGHHVFYEKEACCMLSEDGIYYTNLNAKKHPDKDYLIGENPNYFVILCNTCHGKTNGGFENRKRYANMFRDIIDTKYNGKCYYTKEEWTMMKHIRKF